MRIRAASYMLFLFSVTLLTACEKEDENIDTSTTKILGKWNLDKKSINGAEMVLTECEKKETYDFKSSFQLSTISYTGDLCDIVTSSNWVYDITNNRFSYSNQTAGHNGGELTRRYNLINLTDDNMQLELISEVDGIGEEGDVKDKIVTTWVKNK